LWHRIRLHNQMQLLRADLDDLCNHSAALASPADLVDFEHRLRDLTAALHAVLAAQAVQNSLDSAPLRHATRLLRQASPQPLKHQGWRPVTLHFAQGPAVELCLPYYSRSKPVCGRRGKGCFPALVVLGIHDRCSAALASDLVQLTALLGSFAEARLLLRQRGVRLCVNTLRRIVYHYAQRVRVAQKTLKPFARESLRGRTVVITTDGGRIRIRKDRKARTKKGRVRYSTCWREPKLLLIYTVKHANNRVQMDRSFAVILDGTLQGPDRLFALLRYYLGQLQITQADRVLFIADGARWIWKRVDRLLRGLGVPAGKVQQAVDFYHAVEHLGKVADLAGCFNGKQKKRWLKTQRQRLLLGEAEKVVAAVEELARQHPSKALNAEVSYFVKHGREHKRMEYATLEKLGLPLGSGAMESAIRRVVNLRLKGAGIFWHKGNAEALLLLRCFAKAGRSQDLDTLAFACDLTAPP